MRHIYLVLAAVVLSAVEACESGSVNGMAVARDSAGIRILEQNEPVSAHSQAWIVGEPVLTIGDRTAEPGHDFYRVVGAARLADGMIVVGNAGTGELRQFDADGHLMAAEGRIGQGPNEFRAMSWLGRGGDSIRVWDRSSNRVTVFEGQDLRRAREYVVRPLPETHASMEVRGVLATGEILFARGPDFIPRANAEGEREQRHPISGYLVSPQGDLLREFGPFPGYAVMARRPVPFGGATYMTAGGRQIFVGDNGLYDIRSFDRSGELRQIMRRPHQALPVTASDLEMEIQSRLDGLPPQLRESARSVMVDVPAPEFIPPLKSMTADSEGLLWVQAAGPSHGKQAVWSVLSVERGWLTDVVLAASMQILDVGSDWLLVRDTDQLGVELVKLLPLERG